MNGISLEWYRVFYHVARSGGISQAARQLHVSQSAVSQTIRQLEEALGLTLFVRTPRGVRLTADAEKIFSYVQQAHIFIESAERLVHEQKQLTRGEIRIGAGDTLCRYVLLPHLRKFHQQYPDIHIHVTNRTSDETIKLLLEGHIDLGIVHLPVASDHTLDVIPMMELHDCFVTSRDRLHPADLRMSVKDLAKQPLIMLEAGSSTRRHIDQYFKTNGIELIPEIELGSVDLVVEFAKIGLGMACVAREFIEAELEAGALTEIQADPPVPSRQAAIVSLADVPLSIAAQTFVRQITAKS